MDYMLPVILRDRGITAYFNPRNIVAVTVGTGIRRTTICTMDGEEWEVVQDAEDIMEALTGCDVARDMLNRMASGNTMARRTP